MLNEEQQENFTTLWTEAQPTVSRYVASLLTDSEEVKDVVQKTSLSLLRKFSGYDPNLPFLHWAIGIAKYEILGSKRDAARSRLVFDSEFIERYSQTWAQISPERSQDAVYLQSCIRRLDNRQMELVKMRYLEGMNSREIAEQLRLSAANVRAILKRSRDALRRCVKSQRQLRGI